MLARPMVRPLNQLFFQNIVYMYGLVSGGVVRRGGQDGFLCAYCEHCNGFLQEWTPKNHKKQVKMSQKKGFFARPHTCDRWFSLPLGGLGSQVSPPPPHRPLPSSEPVLDKLDPCTPVTMEVSTRINFQGWDVPGRISNDVPGCVPTLMLCAPHRFVQI